MTKTGLWSENESESETIWAISSQLRVTSICRNQSKLICAFQVSETDENLLWQQQMIYAMIVCDCEFKCQKEIPKQVTTYFY